MRSFKRRTVVIGAATAAIAVLGTSIGLATASQASPASRTSLASHDSQTGTTTCFGVTPATFPARGFITDPARDQGGHMWWKRLPDGSICVGTVVEFVQYNVTMTKTWRVIAYTARHPGGQLIASATFTLRRGWYFDGFRIRRPFAGLTAVCLTADDTFGRSCVHFGNP